MDTVLKVFNVEIPVSLHRARVVHANKYTEAHGGMYNLPVYSTLYTDAVFRLNENNEDLKTYIRNLDLPLYTEQEVTVICSGKTVLGFIDMQTNYYYYVTNDFSRFLGFAFPSWWLWVFTIAGIIAAITIQNQEISLVAFFMIVFAYIFQYTRNWFINRRITRAMDAMLS